MRTRRIKSEDSGMYYHVVNRIAGEPGSLPFDDVAREKMVALLYDVSRLFTVEPIAYQIMGNHFHILVYAPAEALPLEQALDRYNNYYKGKKIPLLPENPSSARIPAYLRDISACVGMMEQRFTVWFNKHWPATRRGKLWGDRFKSTVLEGGEAVRHCLCYVELNAVRAGLVEDPADYRFGSWGAWHGTGKHPFAANFLRHTRACIGGPAETWDIDQIRDHLRSEMARVHVQDAGPVLPETIEAATSEAKKRPGLLVTARRRCRFWSDGLIIGSRTFVIETATAIRSAKDLAKHRVQNLHAADGTTFYAYRRLRLNL
jgi:putative transposase